MTGMDLAAILVALATCASSMAVSILVRKHWDRIEPLTMWGRATLAFGLPVAGLAFIGLVCNSAGVPAPVGIAIGVLVLIVSAMFIDWKVVPWIAKGK